MLLPVLVAVVVVLATFVYLAVTIWGLFGRVKRLGSAVAASAERIADASAGLDAVAPDQPS